MKLLLTLAACVALIVTAPAQSPPAADRAAAPAPDNCEGNAARLDAVRNKSREAGEQKVTILIAKLGGGEQSRELNRRRLHAVRSYLTAMGLPPQRLITAEGEPVDGNGRVEVYVGRCKDLPVGTCESDPEDARRFQLPKTGNAPQCR
jgi:hypothetical protein